MFYSYTRQALIILAMLCATLLTLPQSATAADKLAVVNIQIIMKDSKAANSVRDQVQTKQKQFQSELDKKEKELQEEDKELAKQRSLLSPEAFKQQYQQFRQKAATAQKEIQKKRVQLDKALGEALADIQQNVVTIVAEVAKEKGANMAISTSQVLYADPALDITSEVLTRLDKKVPKLTVKF